MEGTIEVTTTELRQNQKKFLDLAAQGISILVCRGKELFQLTRVPTESRLDDETMRQIEQARQEFKNGETYKFDTFEDLVKHFESLQ